MEIGTVKQVDIDRTMQGAYLDYAMSVIVARALPDVRLSPIAQEVLNDIDKDTVDFGDNFDGSLKEPRILPAALPNLLVNGSSGIAVGMATNIPPHNLGEICDAINYLIDHYKNVDKIGVDDLMRYVKGPDFPTCGLMYRFAGGA